MRTNLTYIVDKEEVYNPNTGKYEKHIISKGFNFCVTGAKTKKEHGDTISDFQTYLGKNGISTDGFGSGSWEEALEYSTDGQKDFNYLSIMINDMDDKEEVICLYKKWKNNRR